MQFWLHTGICGGSFAAFATGELQSSRRAFNVMPRRSCPARALRRPADPALAAPSSVQHPDRVLIRDLLHAKNDVDQSKQLSVGHWIRLLPRHHAWNHEIIALARRGTT